jgi:hypothetical protein
VHTEMFLQVSWAVGCVSQLVGRRMHAQMQQAPVKIA